MSVADVIDAPGMSTPERQRPSRTSHSQRMSLCLPVCRSAYLSDDPAVCLCTAGSICLPACLFIDPVVCLCIAGSRSTSPSSPAQPAAIPAASRLHSRVSHTTAKRNTSPTQLYGMSVQCRVYQKLCAEFLDK